MTRPPSDDGGGPPAVPEIVGGSSIDRKLTFSFDWVQCERILVVYSLLSRSASEPAGGAAFESVPLVTSFSIAGGTIGQQLSDSGWTSLSRGAGPGTEVLEPSGVL